MPEISRVRNYLDNVPVKREYDTVECFDYLDALFPTFQPTGIYRPNALEEERGSLSWGASLLGRSYLKMYEKTENEKYLRGFVGIGEQILLARDHARGAHDYLGRSAPVWRSGRPYTTNLITFRCGALEGPCLEIRSKQATHLMFENIRSDTSTFDIEFLSQPRGPVLASFTGVSLRFQTKNGLSEVLTAQQWKAPQAAAVISHDGCTECLPKPGVYELGEQYYAPAVHVSQICVSLLEFSRIVNEDRKLADNYGEYSQKYVDAAIAALETYEPDYRMLEDRGYYIIPAEAPNDFEGTDAPQNHNMSMALCFLLLSRITGKDAYKTRSRELIRTFKNSLMERGSAGSTRLVWSYFLPGLSNYAGYSGTQPTRWRSARRGNARMEDMSHAVLAVEAAVEAYRQGIEVTSRDLEGMANTFLHVAATGSLANYIDGSAGYGKYDGIAGRWAILGPSDDRVRTTALNILTAAQPQPVHASVLLSCANLVGSASRQADKPAVEVEIAQAPIAGLLS